MNLSIKEAKIKRIIALLKFLETMDEIDIIQPALASIAENLEEELNQPNYKDENE